MTKDVEQRLKDIVSRKITGDVADREAAEAKKRQAAEDLARQNALAAKWRQCIDRLNVVIGEVVERTQDAGIDLQMEKDHSPAAPMIDATQVLLIVDGKNSKKELVLEVSSAGAIRVRTVGTQFKVREAHVDTLDKPALMGIVLDFLDGAVGRQA